MGLMRIAIFISYYYTLTGEERRGEESPAGENEGKAERTTDFFHGYTPDDSAFLTHLDGPNENRDLY